METKLTGRQGREALKVDLWNDAGRGAGGKPFSTSLPAVWATEDLCNIPPATHTDTDGPELCSAE